MPRFRIFSNDRGKSRGVEMYSCLDEVEAPDAVAAIKMMNFSFGKRPLAPLKAVEWPPQSDAAKAWLRRHVG